MKEKKNEGSVALSIVTTTTTFLLITILIIMPYMVQQNSIAQVQNNNNNIDCFNIPISQYKGVNVIDKRLMAIETREWLTFSAPSVSDRLAEIKSHGFNSIRIPYYWEGYINNHTAFINALNEISSIADKLGICVVYDFHQYHTGSRFDYWGGGFPSFLTKSYAGDDIGQIKFWADYYDNNISYNGVKVWDLQSNFISEIIIKTADSHPSTAGYEILNEPRVDYCNQFGKVGSMQTYIGHKMRAVTAKPIFFENAANFSCTDWNNLKLQSQALPRGVSNLVYAPHIYDKVSPTSLSSLHLPLLKDYFQKQQPGMPIYVGEWGWLSGQINQDIVQTYVKEFKDNNIGWAYWVWDPLYDYSLKNNVYESTKYMGYLVEAMTDSFR